MSEPTNYYVKHKRRILWELSLVTKSARPVIGEYFDEPVEILLAEARREFEDLIPQLPYVGGNSPLPSLLSLLACSWRCTGFAKREEKPPNRPAKLFLIAVRLS